MTKALYESAKLFMYSTACTKVLAYYFELKRTCFAFIKPQGSIIIVLIIFINLCCSMYTWLNAKILGLWRMF